MKCNNGEQTRIDNGIFFLCSTTDSDYYGNHCPFVRWCGKNMSFVIREEFTEVPCKLFTNKN